jgi:hypothetical protein
MLQRTFYKLLEQSTSIRIIKRNRVHLRIAATYFATFCFVYFQDDFDRYTRLLRFIDGEHYKEFRENLTNLLNLEIQSESITTDGYKSLLKKINKSITEVGSVDIVVGECLLSINI